jgi:hypothetical protein
MQETGITLKQLTNWMVNNRKRIWKPRIEATIQQQAQATVVAAVAAQAHHAALTAVTLAQQAAQKQDQIISSTAANPVTPEARFKPTVIMPVPSDNVFVQFDVENSIKPQRQPEDQLQPSLVHLQQSLLPPPSDAATKALQVMLLLQQQQQQTNNLIAVAKPPELISEPSTPVSVSMSDEDVSVSALEPPEESVVLATSVPERSPDENDNSKSYYARNVSFSSLELVSGSADHSSSSSPAPLLTSPIKANSTNESNKRGRSSMSSPTNHAVVLVPRRKKHRRVSLHRWVDACSKASHIHDESLPSFEEASRLFGFSK